MTLDKQLHKIAESPFNPRVERREFDAGKMVAAVMPNVANLGIDLAHVATNQWQIEFDQDIGVLLQPVPDFGEYALVSNVTDRTLSFLRQNNFADDHLVSKSDMYFHAWTVAPGLARHGQTQRRD